MTLDRVCWKCSLRASPDAMDSDVVHPVSGKNLGSLPRLMRVQGEVLCRACAFAKYPDGAEWTMVQPSQQKPKPDDTLTKALFGNAPGAKRLQPRPSEVRQKRGSARPTEARQKKGGGRPTELLCRKKKAEAKTGNQPGASDKHQRQNRPSRHRVTLKNPVLTPVHVDRYKARTIEEAVKEYELKKFGSPKSFRQVGALVSDWDSEEAVIIETSRVEVVRRRLPKTDEKALALEIALADCEEEWEMFPTPLRETPLPTVTGGTSHASAPSMLLKEIDVVAEVLAIAAETVIDAFEGDDVAQDDTFLPTEEEDVLVYTDLFCRRMPRYEFGSELEEGIEKPITDEDRLGDPTVRVVDGDTVMDWLVRMPISSDKTLRDLVRRTNRELERLKELHADAA